MSYLYTRINNVHGFIQSVCDAAKNRTHSILLWSRQASNVSVILLSQVNHKTNNIFDMAYSPVNCLSIFIICYRITCMQRVKKDLGFLLSTLDSSRQKEIFLHNHTSIYMMYYINDYNLSQRWSHKFLSGQVIRYNL